MLLKGQLIIYFNAKCFILFSELIIRSLIFSGLESFILAFFNCNDLKFLRTDNHLNHSIETWLPVSSLEIRFSKVLSAAVIVLSSAKFNRSVFVIQRYKSFINILKRIEQLLSLRELPIRLLLVQSSVIVIFYVIFWCVMR